MKQYITQEQYEELTDEQRQAFIAWTLAKGDHAVTYRSIGHLIWFIDDHIGKDGWWNIERGDYGKYWRVQAKYIEFDEDGSVELIDALWEAVKVLLNEEVAKHELE